MTEERKRERLNTRERERKRARECVCVCWLGLIFGSVCVYFLSKTNRKCQIKENTLLVFVFKFGFVFLCIIV